MSAFAEDDARLAAMHGDEPVTVVEQLERVEAKVDALTTLVREIRHALAAGAVGRWT